MFKDTKLRQVGKGVSKPPPPKKKKLRDVIYRQPWMKMNYLGRQKDIATPTFNLRLRVYQNDLIEQTSWSKSIFYLTTKIDVL